MCEKSLCVVCNEREIYASGRCGRCWTYYRKHDGVDRPTVPTWHKGVHSACINCNYGKPYSAGRCKACHSYFERHQCERPQALWQRRQEEAKLARWCKNCGAPRVTGYMRCNSCRRYWKKYSKERPRRYFADDVTCKTCGIPLVLVRKKADRCTRCYEYKRIYKKERPAHLWGNGPHGWCDCGQPAQHKIDNYPLCNGCAVEYKKGAWS